jgi:hypothetical protein
MNLRNLFFSVIAVSLVACGPAVNTTKTTSNDLSIYKTFAYLPNSNFDDLDKGYGNKNIGTTVESVQQSEDRTIQIYVLLSTSTDLDTNITKNLSMQH